ncbi:hypothetical protein SAMN05443432_101769 [Roseovarius litoreus]|uniref:Uncharacterized protein n=1 Tax=Roseovarius litoreus TaxID=1155722 RepID=A0A1M7BD00_9RHOB|nr:hypothetical protein SAMN05443432_101769 [Roseovarius litoreus]
MLQEPGYRTRSFQHKGLMPERGHRAASCGAVFRQGHLFRPSHEDRASSEGVMHRLRSTLQYPRQVAQIRPAAARRPNPGFRPLGLPWATSPLSHRIQPAPRRCAARSMWRRQRICPETARRASMRVGPVSADRPDHLPNAGTWHEQADRNAPSQGRECHHHRCRLRQEFALPRNQGNRRRPPYR